MTKRDKKNLSTEHVLHPEQIRIWKGMIPAEKLQLASNLYWTAWDAKAAWIRQMNPSFTEEQIEEKVRDIFFYAAS
jgi:hypothetical protein